MALTNEEIQKINDMYKQLDAKDVHIAKLTEELGKFDTILSKLDGIAASLQESKPKTAKK